MKLKKLLSFVLASCFVLAVCPTPGVEAATVTWNANKHNDNSYTNGDAILFTPDFNKYHLPGGANHDYSWWRVIVCDYDFDEGVYKVISVNNTTGNGNSKTAIIPRNGFVIADCYSSTFEGLANVKVGDVAYLYNPGKTATVTFGGKGSGTPHAPKGSGIDAPKTNLNTQGFTAASASDGFTLKISDYDSSKEYFLLINDATLCDDGVVKYGPVKLKSDTFKLPKSAFNGTKLLTLYVWAESSAGASPVVRSKTVIFSDAALKSSLTEKKIVAFGDSLTAFNGWVKGMLTQVGTDVINAGYGGDTTVHARARFEKEVLALNPDICIVNFGMNDQAMNLTTKQPNISLDTYKTNLTYIITELQKIGCQVVLVTPHTPHNAANYYKPGQYNLAYTGGFMPQFNQAVRDLAAQYGCGLVDIAEKYKGEDPAKFTNYGDGIHCSEYGHSKYLEWISQYLLAQYPSAGDANGDGKVDQADLDVIKNSLGSGTDDTTAPLDVNRNGILDTCDYLYLKRCVGGNALLRWSK